MPLVGEGKGMLPMSIDAMIARPVMLDCVGRNDCHRLVSETGERMGKERETRHGQ